MVRVRTTSEINRVAWWVFPHTTRLHGRCLGELFFDAGWSAYVASTAGKVTELSSSSFCVSVVFLHLWFVWLKHDGVHVMVPVAINKQTCTISTLLSLSTPPGLQFTTCSRSSVKIFTNGSDFYSFYKCIVTSTRGVQVVQRQIHGCMVGLQDQLTHPHKKLGPGSSCSYTQRNRLHMFFSHTHHVCIHSFVMLHLFCCYVSSFAQFQCWKKLSWPAPQTKLWCLSLTHTMLQAFIVFVSSSHSFPFFLGEKQSPALHTLQFFRRK
jgi:hypothetical protein